MKKKKSLKNKSYTKSILLNIIFGVDEVSNKNDFSKENIRNYSLLFFIPLLFIIIMTYYK
ncbi:MAG: hypothetical protein Q9M94_00065 [Candidatus Gracilibacteria bacterium]|nr:hypothetical protein [Candidatus Gracilibacteria bacterium]MDQ7023212.1 hypothetical protein [Candidatus Gracilibacteria bacterium]